jgi:hypothetical protein
MQIAAVSFLCAIRHFNRSTSGPFQAAASVRVWWPRVADEAGIST